MSPVVAVQVRNHWTAREVPASTFSQKRAAFVMGFCVRFHLNQELLYLKKGKRLGEKTGVGQCLEPSGVEFIWIRRGREEFRKEEDLGIGFEDC